MGTIISKEAYEKLINEDIKWLTNNTEQTLESDHIVRVYNLMGNINADNYIGCICRHFNFGYNVCFKKSDKKFEQ